MNRKQKRNKKKTTRKKTSPKSTPPKETSISVLSINCTRCKSVFEPEDEFDDTCDACIKELSSRVIAEEVGAPQEEEQEYEYLPCRVLTPENFNHVIRVLEELPHKEVKNLIGGLNKLPVQDIGIPFNGNEEA